MNRPKLKPRALLLFVGLTMLAIVAGVTSGVFLATPPSAIPSEYFIVNDAQGSNDQPGQKDLTRMGRAVDNVAGTTKIFFSVDDIASGSDVQDACALFDADLDGKVDYAFCGEFAAVSGVPKLAAGFPKLFQCNDTKTLNCGGAHEIPMPASFQYGDLIGLDPTADLTTATDPWPTDDFYPYDTTLALKWATVDMNAKLMNVCMYPSGSLQSSASDCIANEGGGFLNIVKNSTGGDGSFTFNVTPVPSTNDGNPCTPAQTDCKSYTVATSGGAGSVGLSLAKDTIANVQESNPAPAWALTSASCTIEGGQSTGTFDSNTRTISGITIVVGTLTTCTFTNTKQPAKVTLTKVVTNDNGGTATVGDFLLKVGDTAVTSGAQNTFTDGTYTITESGPTAGYAATFSGNCDASGNITVAAGATYTCTITNNDLPPSLSLHKAVIVDNGGTASATAWTLKADGPTPISGAGGASSGGSFQAGTYTLTESGGPAGYTASVWTCDAGTQNGNQITLGLGQKATCTITNDDQPGTLTVKKVVINTNGVNGKATDFTFKVNNGSPISFVQDTDTLHGKNTLTKNAGTYTITEPAAAGYTTTYDNCSNIVLANGGTQTCTITNQDVPAHLKLVKAVTNDNGGTAKTTDFTLSAAGPTPISGAGGAESDVSVGTYTLSETNLPGYTAGAWSCSGGAFTAPNTIVLTPGQSATCTINNNDQSPHLKLVKTVTNDNGGAAIATNFTLSAAGPTPISGAGGAESDVSLGTYTLTETNLAGYTSGAWSCSGGAFTAPNTITLTLGQSATCTINNNDQTAHLKLVKTVTNDNGGTAAATDFTLSAAGPSPISGAGGAEKDVNAGTYTLSETNLTGYTAGAWSCSGGAFTTPNKIVLTPGQSATCTINNNDQAAHLKLVKTVTNDNGGAAKTTDFTLSAAGPSPISGAGGAESDVNSGSYTLSETNLTGYTAGAWSCSGGAFTTPNKIALTPGQSATCTINNNDQAAHLKLVKTVTNDNGGAAKTTDFTLSAAGPTPISGAGGADKDVNSGAYTLSETNLTGYTAGAWSCTGGAFTAPNTITLALGQSATCTINNNDQTAHLKLVKTVINDNGGTAQTTDFTLSASGTTPINGAGGAENDVNAGNYNLSETGPAGYAASAWSCVGGVLTGSSLSLKLAESATCTITNNDIAPTLVVVKQVVNDNGGSATPTTFSGTVTGSIGSYTWAGGSTTRTLAAGGTYSVTENSVAGYTASYSADCTGSISIGQTKTCTVTNNDIPPSLTLVKLINTGTINDPAVPPSAFTLRATGPSSFSGSGAGVTSGASFRAGTYTLGESGPSGYTAGAWSCTGGVQSGSQITLGIAQTATCAITNTLNNTPPSIKIDKSVSPKNLDKNGGTVTFTVTVSNLSGAYDPFTITSLTDTIYGDLTNASDAKPQGNNTCDKAVGTVIPGGGSYTCTWTSYFPPLTDSKPVVERDVVTVVGNDDDNAGASSIAQASDDATVTQASSIVITNGNCQVDTYRRIFSQDSAYHFTSTNNGQFFYNVAISGVPGETRHLTLELPWPFVTQGSQPIKVYDSFDWVNNCFSNTGSGGDSIDNIIYLKDYGVSMAPPEPAPYKTGYPAPSLQPSLKTRKVELEVKIPSTGFALVRQHIDDDLKSTYYDVNGDGIYDDITYGTDNAQNATDPATGEILMPELFSHPFSMWLFNCSTATAGCSTDPAGPNFVFTGDTSLKNDNDFQKYVGVNGSVLYNGAPAPGMTVQLKSGSKLVGAAITDANGLYVIAYKQTSGKQNFTVTLVNPLSNATVLSGGGTISGMPGSTTKSVNLKSNGTATVDFPLVP